jgi:putative ABC transport system permease protein
VRVRIINPAFPFRPHGFAADLRLAMRRLVATPLFTLFAVMSLAVGLGVTTAVYSVVDAIFLRDLGIVDPARLVFVVTPYDGRALPGSISQPDFEELRRAQTSFSTLSASTSFSAAVTSPSTTELVTAEAVDGAYFVTFGVIPALGRAIRPLDDGSGERVVVLSHGLWRARFGADPAIIGRTVRISGQPFEVIGVAPASFDGARGIPGTRLWVPLAADAASARRDGRQLLVFGRLRPAVSEASASAELAAIAARLDAAFPARTPSGQPRATERPWKAKSARAISEDDTIVRRFGVTLVGLVALVLVVACTNLANLVVARGTARRQELAVRRALGAPRWRLIREQCAESLLVAGAGAVAAYVLFEGIAVLIDGEFNLALPMGGRWTIVVKPTLNVPALAIAGVSLLMSLVVFGLEPALQLTRSSDVRDALAAGAGGIGSPKAGRQRTLLRWQVAISAGFFIIATMFVRYTIAEARHDSGVDMKRLAVAVLNFRAQPWDEMRVRRTLDRVQMEAQNDPAVEGVSASTGMPFGLRDVLRLSLSMPGANDSHNASGIAATPSIFRTIGVTIVRGRGFDERDHSGAPPVIVLSEFTARKVVGTADAVGRQLIVQTGSRRVLVTVIGIARDTDVGRVFGEPHPFVYLPLTQRYDPFLTIVARSTRGDGVALRALRGALRRADPDLAVDVTGTGREILAGPFVFLRAAGMAALVLGALTLLLSMVGLFGIQSHIVARRTREIGVRISCGATAGHIRNMVLKDGYRPVVEGLALGLFIGLTGRAIVRACLDIDVSIIDPWMLLLVPIPLLLAAGCACYLPAHRGASVDPNVALRHV